MKNSLIDIRLFEFWQRSSALELVKTHISPTGNV